MQNLSEEDFKQKYLKYKAKYLNLKGSSRILPGERKKTEETFFKSSLSY